MQWHEVFIWASERLEQYRKQNDGDMSEAETNKLRGRIAVLKELLALPNQKTILESQAKFVTPDDDSHGF
jgi:hypothetical protein